VKHDLPADVVGAVARSVLASARLRLAIAGLVGALVSCPTMAQSVALTGIMGERALLVIDNAAPEVVAPGETRQGVTLVSAGGESAVIEIQGQRQTLRVGERPVSVSGKGDSARAPRVVLNAGSGGHFFGTARFNGVTVPFVVDTGASSVVMGVAQAEQIGLNYRSGQRVSVTTANGVAPGYRISLNSVQIGDVEVFNVDATVVPASISVVLLGNSFLGRFRMTQENDLLLLEKRY